MPHAKEGTTIMNCFQHDDRSAVGLCKACGKGLCPDCAAELPGGLACRGTCESRVQVLHQIIESNSQTMSAARFQTRSAGVFVLLMGAAFLILSVCLYVASQNVSALLIGGSFGVLFFVFGLLRLSRKAQFPGVDTNGQSGSDRVG